MCGCEQRVFVRVHARTCACVHTAHTTMGACACVTTSHEKRRLLATASGLGRTWRQAHGPQVASHLPGLSPHVDRVFDSQLAVGVISPAHNCSVVEQRADVIVAQSNRRRVLTWCPRRYQHNDLCPFLACVTDATLHGAFRRGCIEIGSPLALLLEVTMSRRRYLVGV